MTQLKTQTVGYVRVSSADQNPARQIEGLGTVDKLFTDYLSGASRKERPGLTHAIDYIREGDTFRVYSIDRLTPTNKKTLNVGSTTASPKPPSPTD